MIKTIQSKGFKCCICTFPQLDPKKNLLIQSLNKDIQYVAKSCGIQCITITDVVTHAGGIMVGKSLLTKDGFHLSDWNPIAKYITDNIKL